MYALRPRELLKRRAVSDALFVLQIVGRKDLAEGKMTKPRAAVGKVQLRLRLGPPSQWEHN